MQLRIYIPGRSEYLKCLGFVKIEQEEQRHKQMMMISVLLSTFEYYYMLDGKSVIMVILICEYDDDNALNQHKGIVSENGGGEGLEGW